MRKINRIFLAIAMTLVVFSCAKDQPYLSGHIRRAYDAVMTTCDPYNLGLTHSCIVFSSAFKESLYIYDATAGEMVLAPMKFFPLKVKVGPVTDDLVAVVSKDKQFPFMLAVDRASSVYYPVRLFPSVDGKSRSFEQAKPQKLAKPPHRMAAVDIDNKIVAIATFPKENRIEVYAIKRDTGEIEDSFPIDIPGGAPSRVIIDDKTAVISDEKLNDIHIIDLTNTAAILSKKIKPTKIAIGMPSDRVYLSSRDLGDGPQLYAVLFKAAGKEVKLVNISKGKVEDRLLLDTDPMAGYFPSEESEFCCDGVKKWFSVASLNGALTYIEIKNAGGKITLERKLPAVDLTAEKNLGLSRVHVAKILGGAIERDPSVKRENLCPNNRETFYITSFGNSRAYLYKDPVEVEGHGYSCEGDSTASRFGHKTK